MGNINHEVKKSFDSFCDILDGFGRNVELDAPSPSGDGKMTLPELFYEEMRDYLLYLSCADGFITNEEAEFLDDYLEYYMTPEQMRTRIIQEEIYSTEFEKTEQMILKILVDMENQLGDRGEDIHFYTVLLEIYKIMGGAFLNCDGPMNNDETIAISKYIDMMDNYAAEHLDAYDDIKEKQLAEKRHFGGARAPEKIR